MERPIRALLIDEDPAGLAQLRAAPESGFPSLEAAEARDEDAFRAALSHFRFDVAIVEYRLSWTTGLELLPRINRVSPDCPVIMLTGAGDEEIAVRALKAGFHDYVVKSPRQSARLHASVLMAVEGSREKRRADAVDFRLEDLLARLNVGVCRARPDGTVLYASPAFRRLVSGKPAPSLLPPLHALFPFPAREPDGDRSASHGGMPRVREVRLEAASGTQRWLSLTESSAILSRDGDDEDGKHPVCGEAVIELLAQDITEGKLLELRLREQDEKARRTQNLESIGRLAGGIAHDFNNMLMAINGYSELLMATMERGNPLQSILAKINHAGDRAARLTQGLLAFSRRQMLKASRLDVNRLLAGVVPEARHMLGEDIRLEIDLHPDPQIVFCDGDQIRLALLNLVANARDAMPSGGLLLLATGSRSVPSERGTPGTGARNAGPVDPGLYVVITLADTGVGMDASMQQKIFEPFFTSKPMPDRSGMGLATAFGIVKQSGGDITVESSPGQGARFQIWLPCAPAAQPAPLPPKAVQGRRSGD